MNAAVRHVACSADARYLPYCMTMLHSLFAQSSDGRIVVHYLCPPEFDDAGRDALVRLAARFGHEIMFLTIPDADVAGLPPLRNVRRMVWYRLFLPRLLPAVDRILYLDADTLVLEALDALWDVDLESRPLAAVRNVIEPQTRRRLLPALGLADDVRYFNSGVMVLDLKAMRGGGWADRVLEYARRNAGQLAWADQDALNAVLHDFYKELHPRWNCMSSLFYFPNAADVFDPVHLEEARRAPAVLHFEGPTYTKPWHPYSTHPYRDRYLRELRAAVWYLPQSVAAKLERSAWYALPAALRRLLFSLRHGKKAAPYTAA